MKEGRPRIVFMGTPEIAVESLKAIVNSGYDVVAVVTSPDRPAGRGQKLSESAVKKYAIENGLLVLQPEKLKDETFVDKLRSFNPDIMVVVAFRMLPQVVLNIARICSFNLHASLLPQYRGAAPINWALINGENETGITTFVLNDRIDEGKIIMNEKVIITPHMNASELHDILMVKGSNLVIKTIKTIIKGDIAFIDQRELVGENTILKPAPKIFKNDCCIDWSRGVVEIYNFIRGLSYYPGSFTEFLSPEGKNYFVKIYKSSYTTSDDILKPGLVETDGRTYIRITCNDGHIYLEELQLMCKKLMSVLEFLRGFRLNNHWQVRIL
jgi:methionyl-tRNA formyltransferase